MISSQTNSVSVAFSASPPAKPTWPALIQVPPWGGDIQVAYQGIVTLTNTCPIDNFLTIFHILMKHHPKAYQYFIDSSDLYAATMVQIVNLFDQLLFAEGKIVWLQQFPGRFNLQQVIEINVWPNEEELFVSKLCPSLETSFRSVCDSPSCPSKVKQNNSQFVSLM